MRRDNHSKGGELEQTYTLCTAPQRTDSGNPAAYRQGKAEFYWKSPGEGEHVKVEFGGVLGSC
jgi:hypothetical protein